MASPAKRPDQGITADIRLSESWNSSSHFEKSSIFKSDVIQLRVGLERALYTAHKDVWCRIPWFERCLKRGFQEGDTKIIEMPEERIAAVEQILLYVYHGDLQQANVTHGNHVVHGPFVKTLLDTYIPADKWCMEELGNELTDRLPLSYRNWKVDWLHIMCLRESGLVDSQMRRLMLQQLAAKSRQQGWAGYLQARRDGGAKLVEGCKGGGDDVVELLGSA